MLSRMASITPAPEAMPVTPRWERITAAAALSLIFSGMGQLLNRHPRKAFAFALISHLFGATLAHTHVLLAFPTMLGILAVMLAWKVFVVWEAGYSAAKLKKPETPIPLPWLTYPVLAAAIIAGTVLPTVDRLKTESGFAAFRITSRSMCPTICVGDRVVADMQAFCAHLPTRGDLVLLQHASSEPLFVKRVVGLPGDTVAPGPDNSVLVNGQAFHPAFPCASPNWKIAAAADDSEFEATKIPEGNYFVVGDNAGDSFDSRLPEFGPVTADMIRGQPLFLYWSPTHSRVGCKLR
jgi:signal peptidase I